jgi:hypothetical protein
MKPLVGRYKHIQHLLSYLPTFSSLRQNTGVQSCESEGPNDKVLANVLQSNRISVHY